MSSRAAASRKRLNPGEDKRPSSSSKGFFSRSKKETTASPSPSPSNMAPTALGLNPRMDSPRSSPYHSEMDLVPIRHHARRDFMNEHLRDTPPPTPQPRKMSSPPSTSHGYVSSYPSPPHEDFAAIRLTPKNYRNAYRQEQEEVSFIEASYQPPPPIHATYQPPPPVQTSRINAQRSLPDIPAKRGGGLEDPDVLSDLPRPPTYLPPNPSSSTFASLSYASSYSSSSGRSSALPGLTSDSSSASSSRAQSPTPTLPTYSSSPGPHPYSTGIPDQPALQIAIHNSPLSPRLQEEYHANLSYPSPPSPDPARLPPSPSAELITHSVEAQRKALYRGFGGAYSPPSTPVPNQTLFWQSPPPSALLSPSPRIRPPESISGSSDSSDKSSIKSSPVPPTSGFVFPGSRSVARPKTSKTIGTKAKSKSRVRGDSDASANSPLGYQDSNDFPSPPPLPSHFDDHRNDRYPTGNRRPAGNATSQDGSTTSETGSISSRDSDPARLRRSSDASSTRPRKPAPIAGGSATQFVFPVSRSRAQPALKKKRSRKFSGTTDEEEPKKFMGILKRKKKKSKDTVSSTSSGSKPISESGSDLATDMNPSSTASGSVSRGEPTSQQGGVRQENKDRTPNIKSRIGSYPLDPYDSVLLDNDRHTGELLMRLNPTNSPSFHNYGNNPPASVLDLGCGQGHWVVDAAIAWKGYGTKVTGYDMVDISKGLLPWAAQQGVIDNIRFVRGNFLKQKLPFGAQSFDLVRMSCLALCITSDSWIFVLQEVFRVLMVGGRLELIDDLIFFPYGANSGSGPNALSTPPRLDITIPSSSFTTFSIYDGVTTNPGLGLPIGDTEAEDLYGLYGVREEDPDVEDDSATVNEFNLNSAPETSATKPSQISSNAQSFGYPDLSYETWTQSCATSSDLEALFTHMLLHKFGINKDPSEFVLGLMEEVFGHAREARTMHITLAPPEFGDEEQDRRQGMVGMPNGMSIASRRQSSGLSRAPGLVLWPSTFIPMDRSEIEIHASKHLRLLLSCKNHLIEHALEATQDDEIDPESLLEALWEYEGFLRHRFSPPPPSALSANESNDVGSDAVSIIAESVCSDSREYMWEIQSDFRQHFGWQRSGSDELHGTADEDVNNNPPTTQTSRSPTSPRSLSGPMSPSAANPSRGESTVPPGAEPLYSRDEMTHVRTFRVYEAIKMGETTFGAAM